MIRRMALWLVIAVFVLHFALPARAAEGEILVKTEDPSVTVILLGTPEGNGFRLKENYGGVYLTFDDTLLPELASWFAGKANVGFQGEQQEDCMAFCGLEEGLYLVRSEEGAFSPFMVSLPWDGYQWTVTVDPQEETIPQTGDPVGAAILAMAASWAGLMVFGRRRKMC